MRNLLTFIFAIFLTYSVSSLLLKPIKPRKIADADISSDIVKKVINKTFNTKSKRPPQRKLALKLLNKKPNYYKRQPRKDMALESLKPDLVPFTPVSLVFIGDYKMEVNAKK